MSITRAQISYNANGTPMAEAFGDVYFSNHNGLEESVYVFLQHNDLLRRFRLLQDDDDFTIIETGFGTGLNFLACWQALDSLHHSHQGGPGRVHFISLEKFPLSVNDLNQALQHWPQLEQYSQQLLHQYPDLTPGCHRLVFDCQGYEVLLDLYLGDVQQLLPEIYSPPLGLVDAWFLDGFAPSKNPDMWTDSLYREMVRLAKPGCTFATFTAAGKVRRGLQEAGFEVNKCAGFGTKRDMLRGILTDKPSVTVRKPWFTRHHHNTTRVTVVGGGLAGANLCYALCKQGYEVELFTEQLGGDASGNPQGGFYPQLHTQNNTASNFMAQAFGFAGRLYRQLAGQHAFPHQFCGVLQLGFNPKEQARLAKLAANGQWPVSLTRPVSSDQASDIAGLALAYPGLFIPNGGWINPAGLIQALFSACGDNLTLIPGNVLRGVERQQNRWMLHWNTEPPHPTDCLVLATGARSAEIPLLSDLPLRPVRGQVEAIPSQAPVDRLKTVLCHKGYLTPALNGHHALGSTYVKNDNSSDYRPQEEEQNLATQRTALSDCQWVHQLEGKQQGRASVRLSTPDHLPIVGAMADFKLQRQDYAQLRKGHRDAHYPPATDLPGLFVFCGLGSRGLCTAPLLAEALACQISGKPMPLDGTTLAALNPNRFLIRELIRQPG